jgi:hypothetical protein
MSRRPGPENHAPFSPFLPASTPGPLGVRDRADPNVNAHPGDTPGPLGKNDGAAELAKRKPVRNQSANVTNTSGAVTGGAGLPARMLSSMILGASPDAGAVKTGLFAYHVGTDTIAEAKNICSEPIKGPYRKTVYVENMKALSTAVGAADFKVTRLGVLVHGDVGGRLWVGDDELNPATVEDFKSDFQSLSKNLTKDATFLAYGCVSGVGKDGSVLLKQISKLLPGRSIVGFNVINSVNPTSMRKEGANVFGWGGRSCFDPEVWASNFRSAIDAAAPGSKPFVNEATENAPQAKVARDGRIVKWPSDESPKTDDATKEDALKRWKSSKK